MTQLVGILNITPDSFSDGGEFTRVSTALAHAEKLIADGAAVIDVGAESTRPNATPLSHEEEWQRLSPLLPELKHLLRDRDITLSIDTRHAKTAHRAIEMGADWINDVSGCDDLCMRNVIAQSDVSLVIMHHLGIPASSASLLPESCDVISTLTLWAQNKITQLQEAGIAKERIIVDPGIGFGKSARHSWDIIRHVAAFRSLGVPLMIGHSRKSFLMQFNPHQAETRDIETYAVSRYLSAQQVDYLRVHDVEGHRRMLAVSEFLTQ